MKFLDSIRGERDFLFLFCDYRIGTFSYNHDLNNLLLVDTNLITNILKNHTIDTKKKPVRNPDLTPYHKWSRSNFLVNLAHDNFDIGDQFSSQTSQDFVLLISMDE